MRQKLTSSALYFVRFQVLTIVCVCVSVLHYTFM